MTAELPVEIAKEYGGPYQVVGVWSGAVAVVVADGYRDLWKHRGGQWVRVQHDAQGVPEVEQVPVADKVPGGEVVPEVVNVPRNRVKKLPETPPSSGSD
jgi:hypothetical protein